MKAFCHSVNVHGVVVLFAGGGDTSTHVITEPFALRASAERKTSSNCMGERPHAQVKRPHAQGKRPRAQSP